jgi:hypothetical protein
MAHGKRTANGGRRILRIHVPVNAEFIICASSFILHPSSF